MEIGKKLRYGTEPVADPHVRRYFRFIERMSMLQTISLVLFILLLSFVILGLLPPTIIQIDGQELSNCLFGSP
ncbi:MAG: hypothetical protein GX552_09090 [Chloroflexi bacterium]|jgi:hypothetical protein|nr:hypothetical protein [Chloroflexota bacterium]